MRWFLLAVSIWLFQATQARAQQSLLPNAIYRFEIGASLEKLNLIEGLAQSGKPCLFTRQESDGSTTEVLVFSDELSSYLATLQMPSVMLTFKLAEYRYSRGSIDPAYTQVATVHGRDVSKFNLGMSIIRKRDLQGKAAPALSVLLLNLPSSPCR